MNSEVSGEGKTVRHLTTSGTKRCHNHFRFWMNTIIVLLSCLLIAGCEVGSVNGNGSNNGVGNGNTGNCNGVNNCNTTNNTTSTSSDNTQPANGVTPASTPTPIQEPKSYRANWSSGMDGWMTTDDDWHVVSGLLVNDGI